MALLVVDDAAIDRLALALMLNSAGYTAPLLASSAAEALACLERHTPDDIELILTGLNMPDVDGIMACRQIKAMAAWSDTPVIMVTSSDEVGDLSAAFEAGAIDYLTKPVNKVELMARVRSAVRLKHEMDRRKARERELKALNQRLEGVLSELAEQHTLLQREQTTSERLLLNILPPPIAERLKQAPGIIADRFEAVTVLFADIVGFTELAASMAPEALVSLLNEIFSHFDQDRITGAFVEGANGLARVLSRMGRGYGLKALRGRLLYGLCEDRSRKRLPTKESRNGDGVDGPFLGVPLSTLLPQDLSGNGDAPSTLESR